MPPLRIFLVLRRNFSFFLEFSSLEGKSSQRLSFFLEFLAWVLVFSAADVKKSLLKPSSVVANIIFWRVYRVIVFPSDNILVFALVILYLRTLSLVFLWTHPICRFGGEPWLALMTPSRFPGREWSLICGYLPTIFRRPSTHLSLKADHRQQQPTSGSAP